MSSDGFTYSSNLLKRIKPISMKKNRKKNEGSKPSSMNKLQSLGMSIITSVSRRSKSETTKKNTTNDHHRNSNMMYTHIGDSKDRIERTPTLSYSTPTPSPVNPLFVIKPTVSTRPISQFFSSSTLIKENDKKLKRHSMMGSPYTNNSYINFYRGMPLSDTSSTRSSSLRTVRQSDLINDSSDYEPTTILPAEPLSPIEKRMMKTSRKEKRMSTVSLARARTAFGMDSIKSRENRAIHEWNEYISRSALEADNYMKEDGLHKILLHPFLLQQPEHPLERQRFVPQSPSKERTMIRFILNELIDTEESYNKLLLLIRTRYMEPMIAASKKKFPLVKESDIPILFNHLPALLKLSNEILIRCKTSTNIGEIFRDLESDLVVFHKYAAHYRSKTKTIRKACNNVLFLKIDQENLARKDTNRLGMSDYFIAPIQRIPRYCLLLKDLQKYTNKQVPQYYDLEYALNSLTQLAVTMDHVKMKISPPLPSRHTN